MDSAALSGGTAEQRGDAHVVFEVLGPGFRTWPVGRRRSDERASRIDGPQSLFGRGITGRGAADARFPVALDVLSNVAEIHAMIIAQTASPDVAGERYRDVPNRASADVFSRPSLSLANPA